MTDKPTPTTDLLKRGVEIHEGRSTGVLSGEALRDYAKRKWPDLHGTLQMAEHETVTEALALLAKWGPPAQARAASVLYDPKAVLDVFNSARAGSDKSSGYLRGILAVIAHWESRPEPHRWLVPAQADSVLEDAARLDYLHSMGSTIEMLPGEVDFYPMRFRVGGLRSAVSPNLREAIDIAREEARDAPVG